MRKSGFGMKKVLVIANLFHAFPRIPGITTYLPDFDWQATIISPPIEKNLQKHLGFPKKFEENTKIVSASYRGDIFWFWRKIFKLFGYKTQESITEQIKLRAGITSQKSIFDILMIFYQTIFAYPDTEITWQKPAFKVAAQIANHENFDVLLSSSPFPTSHIIASKIKNQFSLPWVADFRDPWTQNHNYSFNRFRKHFETKLEKNILSSADIITAATSGYSKKQGILHNKDVITITNGFDPEYLQLTGNHSTEKFSITYTGIIYPEKQKAQKLFQAINNLISKNLISPDDLDIRFFGPIQNFLNEEIINYHLDKMAKQYGPISRYEVLQKQKESHLLLLLNWEDPKDKGVCPGKFYEYLSAQKMILATGGFPQTEIQKMLSETQAGIYASTISEIESALLNYYREYKQNGFVNFYGSLKEISKYSYHQIAKQFSDIFNNIRRAKNG